MSIETGIVVYLIIGVGFVSGALIRERSFPRDMEDACTVTGMVVLWLPFLIIEAFRALRGDYP